MKNTIVNTKNKWYNYYNGIMDEKTNVSNPYKRRRLYDFQKDIKCDFGVGDATFLSACYGRGTDTYFS